LSVTCHPLHRPYSPLHRAGEQWLHEIKFDGWRVQLHKHERSAAPFTKNGHDHSSSVRSMVDALACLKGMRSLVINRELVACDSDGRTFSQARL
jgi:bifunctional non-homologous end joining protein LigD